MWKIIHLIRSCEDTHQGNTEKERNHNCDSCGKYFSRLGHLKTHIEALHGEQKSYKCDSCGKLYNTKNGLKNHMEVIHEGQKNYKCDTCGKSFTISGSLKIHIKTIHEGQKNTNVILVKNPSPYQEVLKIISK